MRTAPPQFQSYYDGLLQRQRQKDNPLDFSIRRCYRTQRSHKKGVEEAIKAYQRAQLENPSEPQLTATAAWDKVAIDATKELDEENYRRQLLEAITQYTNSHPECSDQDIRDCFKKKWAEIKAQGKHNDPFPILERYLGGRAAARDMQQAFESNQQAYLQSIRAAENRLSVIKTELATLDKQDKDGRIKLDAANLNIKEREYFAAQARVDQFKRQIQDVGTAVRQETRERLQQLKTQLEQAEAEFKRVEAEHKALAANLLAVRYGQLVNERDQLYNQLLIPSSDEYQKFTAARRLEIEVLGLHQQARAKEQAIASQAAEVTRLAKEIESAKAEKAKLEREDPETRFARLIAEEEKKAEAAIDALNKTTELQQLEDQITKARERLAELDQQQTELTERRDELTRRIGEMQTPPDEPTERTAHGALLLNLEQEKARVTSKLSQCQQEIAQTAGRHTDLTTQHDQLQAQLGTATERTTQEAQINQNKALKIVELQRQKAAAIDAHTTKLAKLGTELTDLRHQQTTANPHQVETEQAVINELREQATEKAAAANAHHDAATAAVIERLHSCQSAVTATRNQPMLEKVTAEHSAILNSDVLKAYGDWVRACDQILFAARLPAENNPEDVRKDNAHEQLLHDGLITSDHKDKSPPKALDQRYRFEDIVPPEEMKADSTASYPEGYRALQKQITVVNNLLEQIYEHRQQLDGHAHSPEQLQALKARQLEAARQTRARLIEELNVLDQQLAHTSQANKVLLASKESSSERLRKRIEQLRQTLNLSKPAFILEYDPENDEERPWILRMGGGSKKLTDQHGNLIRLSNAEVVKELGNDPNLVVAHGGFAEHFEASFTSGEGALFANIVCFGWIECIIDGFKNSGSIAVYPRTGSHGGQQAINNAEQRLIRYAAQRDSQNTDPLSASATVSGAPTGPGAAAGA